MKISLETKYDPGDIVVMGKKVIRLDYIKLKSFGEYSFYGTEIGGLSCREINEDEIDYKLIREVKEQDQ